MALKTSLVLLTFHSTKGENNDGREELHVESLLC
jgi:hypothetical protein